MFLNLLYKSLKADVSLRRVKAFAKRLLHVSAGQSAGFACGALFLLSEVMKAKPGLRTLLQQDEVMTLPSSSWSHKHYCSCFRFLFAYIYTHKYICVDEWMDIDFFLLFYDVLYNN